ncbi:MAG: HAMP domain-containing protein [Deltaproteobacteria bacterium]|nr:HAMP domain-containing protein [Deltaproteobacteria bacterium]MCB9788325.1 HAMP domain-containing protein [Deltaproteobacteria bacterium]
MKLSVSTRIFLGFTVVIVAFGSACAYTIFRMTLLRESVTLIWEEVMPVASQMKDLSRQLRAPEEFLDLRRPSDAVWLARLLPSLQPFQHLRTVEARLDRLVETPALPAEDRETLSAVSQALEDFRQGDGLRAAIAGPEGAAALGLPETGSSDAIFDALVRRTVKQANERVLTASSPEVRAMTRALRRINRAVMEASRAISDPIRDLNLRAASDEKAATLAVLLITAGALVLSLVILFMIQRILSPLRDLREGARKIAAGHYDERVDVRSRDEIGQLGLEFNTMAEALSARDAELARQREELLRADRLATIGKMAAQITHEVRNPLSSIALNAELLEEELESAAEGGEARAILLQIDQEVQRLKAITEEYLAYARLPRPALQPVDVGAHLAELLRFVRRELTAAEIELRAEGVLPAGEGGPAPILADPDQLRRVWLNLVRNARESLEEVEGPRWLEVSLSGAPDGGVVIRLMDNGRGVDPALREHLFEPFVTGKAGGTGLGLALSQQIVSDHGGTLEVRDRPDGGRGIAFILRIPARGPAFRDPAGIHNGR